MRGVIGSLALAALLLLGATVEASVLRGLTVNQLRRAADTIVAGRVVGIEAVRMRKSIETRVRIRVDRAWRGARRGRLTVTIPGGVVAGQRLLVPGAPTFQHGESVLLFLYRDGSEYRPVGLFQGVWHLSPEDPHLALASDSGGAARLAPPNGRMANERSSRTVTDLVGRSGGDQ